MKSKIVKILFILSSIFCISDFAMAQNNNFITSIALGAGNSGFQIEEQTEGDAKRLFYPMGGIQIQKRIGPKWAIIFFPNVGMSGNRRTLTVPLENITEVKTTSAYVNLAIHPKYYLSQKFYVSLGPEISYLLWNYGSTYDGDTRLSNIEETRFFNRTNLVASSSLGFSTKVGESRKNAPIQIDALWFVELRAKQGITNILNKDFFAENLKSRISSIELVMGISFSSKN